MKTALEILNRVEPNGELLDTETALRAMREYAAQFKVKPMTDDEIEQFDLSYPGMCPSIHLLVAFQNKLLNERKEK